MEPGMKLVLTLVSAGFAIASAVLWFRSAKVKVPYKDLFDSKGNPIGSIAKDGIDLILTAEKQSLISGHAAICASIAALAQSALAVFY